MLRNFAIILNRFFNSFIFFICSCCTQS